LTQALREPVLRGGPAASRRQHRHELLIHARRFRGRHHAAAILVIAVVAGGLFRAFPGHDVTILSDGQAYRVSATFDTPGEALGAANISLAPGDRVLVAGTERHTSIAVHEARPVVTLVDGISARYRTTAATAAGALAEAGIELRPGDLVYINGVLASGRAPLAGVRYASSRPPAADAAPIVDETIVISVDRARPFTVFIDHLRVDTHSAETSVAGLLTHLGMTVREGDLVRPSLDTPLAAGMTVYLAKARTVNVTLNGKETALYTQAATVGEVLALLGVDPGPGDLLSVPREATVFNGMNVVIGTTEVVNEDVQEDIPPTTVFEEDSALPRGEVRIVNGKPGRKTVTYSVTYRNGEEVARSVFSAVTAAAAVPTRHISGTATGSSPSSIVSVEGYSGPYRQKVRVWATWYNASHGAWSRDDPNYGRTASGVMLDHGICAVDPSVLPMGTRFMVPGYGVCLAADTGGGIKGSKVDLGFPEAAGSNPWHTGYVDIYILD